MATWVKDAIAGRGLLFSADIRIGPVKYEIVVTEEHGSPEVRGHCVPDSPHVVFEPSLLNPKLRLASGEMILLTNYNPPDAKRLDFEVIDPESIAICWKKAT